MTLLAHELIELGARRTPDARAVECGGRSISYAELDGRANQLAQHLQALGVGPEVVVGVHLERTPDLIVALLGVLKAGGAYLPLDPAAPPDRVALMLDDARSQVVIAKSSGASGLGHNGRRLVRIDDSRTGECPEPPPRAHFNPQQPAYVIYTSGSTGRPKGVVIEQRSLAAFASQSVTPYGLNQSDRVLQFASISFDA